ncbi:MAG: hypothetical protein CMI60_03875 [Parvibaculum sp.]|nr:hypothetical protein [Parvibaculum sp.]
MKKSYLMINCDIQNDGSAGINNTVLTKSSFARAEQYALAPSEIMIKHAHLEFENTGMVEDIRDVNVLKCNMKQYSEDPIKKISDSYRSFNGINDGNSLAGSPFRDLVKSGSVVSTNKSHDIRVDMSSLFGLGEVEQLDTGRLGQGMMHLTLDFDDIGFQSYTGKTADDVQGGSYWGLVEARSNATGAQRSSNGSVGTRTAINKGTIAAADVAGAIYQMTRDYDSLEDSPFYVGQQVEISFTNSATPPVAVAETKTINSISYNAGNKKISLTVDSALTPGGAGDLTLVSLTGIDSPANTFVVNNVTFVMYEDVSGQKPPSSIQYKTYTVERDTENAITAYSKMFYVEPECANMFVLCPDGDTSGTPAATPSKYISDLDISDYRLRVNGADLTNRPIKMNTPEHWDRLGRTFLNMDMQLNSIRSKVPKISNQRATEDGVPEIKLIAECFSLTASAKQVQVDINSGRGVRTIYLFKEVIREI